MLKKLVPVKTSQQRDTRSYQRLLREVIGLVESGRAAAGRVVNQTITATYWLVGRQIVEHEQGGEARAIYGEELIVQLAGELTRRFGRGFSVRNLEQMRQFFCKWPIPQTPSAVLGDVSKRRKAQTVSAVLEKPGVPLFALPWSHYVRLMSVKDEDARGYYEAEAICGSWSFRQLDRQISSLAYQRTKSKKRLAAGSPSTADELVRDPFVLEFLGLKDEYSESEMEDALIGELQKFLLELGNDFSFVARQKRLRIGDEWYRVDLLLFHRRLRCLVILDLKIGKFSHADAGQMNMYLNYAQQHWTHEGENPPVGLILCSEKDSAVAHYALGNLQNTVLAREYHLTLPKEKEWKARLRKVRKNLVSQSV